MRTAQFATRRAEAPAWPLNLTISCECAANVEEDAELAEISARNCVYIQYCVSPDTGGVICRSRRNMCGCTLQEALDECFRDARAVCGNWREMDAYVCHSD